MPGSPETTSPPKSVFISYSHKDRRWLRELNTTLAPIERTGQIRFWDDTAIEMGDRWRIEIAAALRTSFAAILLVSPDFLASPFIINEELPALLRQFHGHENRIVSVFVRSSSVDRVPIQYASPDGKPAHALLTQFQGFIAPDRPLSLLGRPKRDEALTTFASLLASVLGVSDAFGLQAPATPRPPDADAEPPADNRLCQVELHIDLTHVSTKDLESTRRRLSSYLEIPPDSIRVVQRRTGSVILDLEMPYTAALELCDFVGMGVFRQIDIDKCRLLGAPYAPPQAAVGLTEGKRLRWLQHDAFIQVEIRDRNFLDEDNLRESADEFQALIAKATKPKIVLSFRQVDHLSSAALGMLITLHNRVRSAGGSLMLVAVSPAIMEVFQLTRLNRVFRIGSGGGDVRVFASIDEAAAAIRRGEA